MYSDLNIFTPRKQCSHGFMIFSKRYTLTSVRGGLALLQAFTSSKRK